MDGLKATIEGLAKLYAAGEDSALCADLRRLASSASPLWSPY